ncbi:cell cycle protein MesJ [Exophiala viscosa]|uniref:tRNA(Ile)-lysidine synthetase n=2 Tax=Exophiala viscosa TaxID=2486360 RepID=A0AAN6IEW5_9EURO|nr:cell cycle protein MesJ [Exophiala viscosa]
MALAWLLKQLPKLDKRLQAVEPIAFIVDHKARNGSREEAEFVSNELDKMDVKSVILSMQWSGTLDPSELSDFEFRARVSRYRLIASAAIRRKIRHLFVGHHQDDQVETVLMRLIRNSTTSTAFLGLQGMADRTTIPCCESIRGAHERPPYERFEQWHQTPDTAQLNSKMENSTLDQDHLNRGKVVTVSRPGGLQIHRPLLPFPKSRLVDICESNHIKYVKDKTNEDPTLTLRNAVRYMRAKYTLPRALMAESMLHLLQWAQTSAQDLVERGTRLLNMVDVVTFDLRSGMMTISVASEFVQACQKLQSGANALAQLTSVVSCQHRAAIPTLVSHQNLEDFLQIMQSPELRRTTIQQVLLERLQSASQDASGSVLVRLARPPMRPAEVALATQGFSPSAPRDDDLPNEDGIWSEWLLWDHRYWIRVRTKNASRLEQIAVRPFQVADEGHLRQMVKQERDELHSMLAEAAPGKLRYTLPILTFLGEISVFPTLNVLIQRPPTEKLDSTLNEHPLLEWEACYKAIDQPFINERKSTIEWRNAQIKRL